MMLQRKTPCDVCGNRAIRIREYTFKEGNILNKVHEERCSNRSCNNLLYGLIEPEKVKND
jgi:hypothetical protein